MKAKVRALKEEVLRKTSVVMDVHKGLAALDEGALVDIDGLLAEMSLYLPNSTVRKAEKAAIARDRDRLAGCRAT